MKMTLLKTTLYSASFLMLFSLASCGGGGSDAEGDATVDTEEPAEPELVESTAYCMYDNASIREGVDQDSKWMTSMRIGEKVTFTGEMMADSTDDDNDMRVKVRLSDGTEGWANESLMLMEGAIGVTTEEVQLYSRPDDLTLEDGKVIPRMVIVGLYNTQGDWTEIKGIPPGKRWYTTGWTKHPHVSDKPEDIAAALFINRALAEEDVDKKIAGLETVLSNYANSPFAIDASEWISEFSMESLNEIEDMMEGMEGEEPEME